MAHFGKPPDRPSFGKKPASDKPIDAIDQLPLSIIPLKTNSLKSAKLVKNSRMETMIELFHDPVAGALMIEPSRLSDTFGNKDDVVSDQNILIKLGELSSYDVYTLRGALRKMGLDATPPDALDLSFDMKEALHTYTINFIRPIVINIFGHEFANQNKGQSLSDIFKSSDPQVVLKNLTLMSQKTSIPIDKIPDFLEKYSDTFMSVAYFRYLYDMNEPEIRRCIDWLNETKNYRDVKSMPGMVPQIERIEKALLRLSGLVSINMVKFNQSFEAFWAEINQETFKQLQDDIINTHGLLGAILCGLNVKMQAWSRAFPNNAEGNPNKRSSFIKTELEPGIERLLKIESGQPLR
jgi:hypothetical protein